MFIKIYLQLFFLFTFTVKKRVIMGAPYKCIEGDTLGRMGGAWFASYSAYNVNIRFPWATNLPINSLHWQNVIHQGRTTRFNNSSLWVLMPNGRVNKASLTIQAKNLLIKQGGVSIHAYWALWILTHCSSSISTNHIGLSLQQVRSILLQAIPFL